MVKKIMDAGNVAWLNNKQLLILLFIAIPMVFTTGMSYRKFASMPEITAEQWNAVYAYSVKEQPERERRYDKIIQGFEVENIKHINMIEKNSDAFTRLEGRSARIEKALNVMNSQLIRLKLVSVVETEETSTIWND